MPDGPTGTVTLVFTDIEASTQLWERFAEAFKPVLALHDQIMREAIGEFSGYEVQTAGDAFMLAFASAGDALLYCLETQRRLQDADWPEGLLSDETVSKYVGVSEDGTFRGVRVRMGIHTGEPFIRRDPTTGRLDYGGRMCNRAARVGSLPHGGQVVLSGASFEAVKDLLNTEPLELVDLGEHALRGFEQREQLWQVLPKRFAGRRFPRVRTADLRQTNLTQRLSRFFGRERELEALSERLDGGDRLLTLLGPGGTGKTRLAMRFGAFHLEDYPGGVWWCDLTEARSLEALCGAVARALGANLATEAIADEVGGLVAARGRVLLFLDNFEQVVSLAPETVGAWLAMAPEAVFLVTSREPLHIEGERVFKIDPLPTEDGVRLFTDRAQLVRSDFQLTRENQGTVERIVERLDGLSLAIELAAARVAMLPPARILERLDQRFKLLRGRRRDHDARQATLQGAIDWSWELLEPWEKLGLAQCSVFRGGFDLDAAENVLDVGAWPDAPWAMDLVESLVDKSLLRVLEPLDGHERMNMYESIRHYACNKLEGPGAVPGPEGTALTGPDAAQATRLRHVDHYAAIGSRPFPQAVNEGDGAIELENFIAATEVAISTGSLGRASGAVHAALRLFWLRGPMVAGLGFAERVLAASGLAAVDVAWVRLRKGDLLIRLGRNDEAWPNYDFAARVAEEVENGALKAQCSRGFAQICMARMQKKEAREHFETGLAAAAGAAYELSMMHMGLGVLEHDSGSRVQAQVHYQTALAYLEGIGDAHQLGLCLSNLALLSLERGQIADAIELYERAIEMSEKRGTRWAQAIQTLNLAEALRQDGREDACEQRLEEGLALTSQVNAPDLKAYGHVTRGRLRLEQGRMDEAEVDLEIALAFFREVGDPRYEGFAASVLGDLYRRIGRLEEAEKLFEPGMRKLRDWGEPTFLGRALGFLGLLRLAQGDTKAARALLAEGEVCIGRVEALPTSDLARTVDELRRALEAC